MSGHVHRRGTYADGKTRWVARYRGADRKERQKSFRRQVDANSWLDDRRAEVTTGDWVPPERAKRPFDDLADEWLDLHTGKPSTIAGYQSVLNRHIRPAFGKREIGSIERAEIRKWVTNLGDELRPNSVRNALNCLKGVFSHAVEAGALKASPATRIAAPRSERVEMRFASSDDVAALAATITEPYGVLVTTAAYTGLRAGELAALRVRDVDLMRGRIHVRQAVSEVHGRLIYGAPKSGKTRTVSVPSFLRDMLTEHVAAFATDPDALVFTSPDGGPLRRSNFYRRHFRPAADALGLEDLRFHDLRHSCASFLIAAGAHPRAIMERLGHSSIAITMDTYGHLLPSLDDALTVALEDQFHSVSTARSDVVRGVCGEIGEVVPFETGGKTGETPA